MDIGWQELAIILVIVIIIFGADRLPELGSGLGKAIHGFREAAEAPDDEARESAETPRPHVLTASNVDLDDRVLGASRTTESAAKEHAVRADEV